MKRTYLIFTAIVLLCALPVVAAALNDEMKVYVNGNLIETSPMPQVHDGIPFLPVSMLKDDLNIMVAAASSNREVYIQHSGSEVYLSSGSSTAQVNGSEIALNAQPYLDQGELYIPMKPLDQHLGLKVYWDAFTSSVFIFQKNWSIKHIFQPGAGQEQSDSSDVDASLALISEIRSEADRVVIQLNQEPHVDAKVIHEANRIIIDFPGAAFAEMLNGAKAEHLGMLESNTAGVDRIRYSFFQYEPSTIRVVLDKRGALSSELIKDRDNHQWIIKLSKPEKIYKVVIDAGHGGKDPGAEGASGREEKHFNLDLSRKIFDLLQQIPEIEPHMTRVDDSYIALQDRAAYANQLKADLFISIHGNTYDDPVSGTETYYWSNESYEFAKVIHEHVLQGTGFPDRNVRKTAFKVLTETKMPAALLELGYLSNAKDEQVMLTEEFQNRTAKSIVSGIRAYLGLGE